MDRHTKTVLTIIAVILAWTALKDTQLVSEVKASSGVIEVRVVDMNLTRYRPLPVHVQGEINCKPR